MDVFGKIEGSVAITRHPGGVLRQTDLYARGKDVFIKVSGGFVRIVQRFGGPGQEFLTTNSSIKVLEFEGEGVKTETNGKVSFTAPARLRAVN